MKLFKGLVETVGGGLGSIFGGLLKQSKMPEIMMPSTPDAVKAPTIDQAALAAESADKLRRRRGRGSTILAGAETNAATSGLSIGTKTLLGQ